MEGLGPKPPEAKVPNIRDLQLTYDAPDLIHRLPPTKKHLMIHYHRGMVGNVATRRVGKGGHLQ